MPECTHLHVHSTYSLDDGIARIPDLVAAAKNMGMTSLALTDHGHLHGLPEFVKECKKAGLNPICGTEAYLSGVDLDRVHEARNVSSKKRTEDEQSLIETAKTRFHQILLAKNETGVRNLYKLMSWAQTDGYYYKPLIDFERLRQHSEGLIATSSCMISMINRNVVAGNYEEAERVARWFKDVFAEDFYFEVHNHDIEEEERIRDWVEAMAPKLGIPVICANDVHYIEKAHYELQKVKVFLSYNSRDAVDYAHEGLHLATPQEMAQLFHSQFPDALENTMAVADKIDPKALHFDHAFAVPDVGLPREYKTEADYLFDVCKTQLQSVYPPGSPRREEAEERLLYELSTLKTMQTERGTDFFKYFLVVGDITQAARNKGIAVGPGRGSAAGSIVAYLLGITNVDPLEYDLLFERFLNPERVSMPDIDIDFQDDRRQEVFEYIREKYGEDHTAQIITFGMMGSKTAIRDAGRFLNVPLADVNLLSDKVPLNPGEKEFYEDWLDDETVKQKIERSPDVKQLSELAPGLFGQCRHTGIHAAGMIITPGLVTDYAPVCMQSSKGKKVVATQYSGKYVEDFGLLKMDILGLKTLSILQTALSMIGENYGQSIDLDHIPMNDPQTMHIFRQGKTDGVFQFESGGMKEWLIKLKPDTIHDLIAMNALYRPGPMDLIPSYIKRKHGEEEVEYPHPVLEDVLSQTYGIPVYQEQVMKIAQVMGGFSLGRADNLRRGVGKKIQSVIDEMKPEFIQGAENQGIPRGTAEEVWEMMAKFASYGFNKSHSAAYALIAYQAAYLKAHYPVEFMAATIHHESGDAKKKAYYVQSAHDMGIEIKPPSVNFSGPHFTAYPVRDAMTAGQVGAA